MRTYPVHRVNWCTRCTQPQKRPSKIFQKIRKKVWTYIMLISNMSQNFNFKFITELKKQNRQIRQWIVPKCKLGFEFGPLSLLIQICHFHCSCSVTNLKLKFCDILDMSIMYIQTFFRISAAPNCSCSAAPFSTGEHHPTTATATIQPSWPRRITISTWPAVQIIHNCSTLIWFPSTPLPTKKKSNP